MERDPNTAREFLNYELISIHSLRVERDVDEDVVAALERKISIHSLRVERDVHINMNTITIKKFQSTLSVWRETNLTHQSSAS